MLGHTVTDDEEQAKDSLGLKPTPMTGGTDIWAQFGANSFHIRAAFKSSFGLKVKHPTMNSEVYKSLFNIEGRERVEQVVAKEVLAGIKRKPRTVKGETTTMVYMSEEDEKSQNPLTLDESRDARAAAVNIPHDVMAKLDLFVRLSLELDKAAKDLHKVAAIQPGVEFTSLKVFEDLQGRADTSRKEKDESDPAKLTELKNASEAEKKYCEQRIAELKPKQQALPQEIEELKEVNKRLDLAIKSKLENDEEEDAALDLLQRRTNRTKIQEKDGELMALDATIEQVETGLKRLIEQIKGYEAAISAGGTLSHSTKMQKTKL